MSTQEYEKSVLAIGEVITDCLHLYAGTEDCTKNIEILKLEIPGIHLRLNTRDGKKYAIAIHEI